MSLCLRIVTAAVGLLSGSVFLLGPGGEDLRRVAAVPVEPKYGRLPLSFERNVGQTDSRVDFIVRGAGYGVWLTPGEAVLGLRGKVVRVGVQGGDSRARVEGLRKLPGKVNYIVGRDEREWHTGIDTFAKVRYLDVLPGIDQVFYGTQGRLEYDFVVAPGANPREIAIEFEGAKRLTLDRSGDLLIDLGTGTVRQHKPRVYQRIGGTRRTIDGAYVLRNDGRVSFAIGRYERSAPLVVDPMLDYSTYLGGTGYELGYAVAVDSSGSAYITGTTGSADFPTTAGAYDGSLSGAGSNAYVAKLNPAGNALVYSTYLGGTTGTTTASGIAVNAGGEAYVAGDVGGVDFPTTAGAFQREMHGGFEAFVTRLNAEGSGLVYSTFLGGDFDDFARDITLDAEGNALVTGDVHSAVPDPAFPTKNAFQPRYGGGDQDAFVTKLNAFGTGLVYSSYLGGGSDINSNDDWGEGIAVDGAGNAYVTGFTFSFDFPRTPGSFQPQLSGSLDAYVTKVKPAGGLGYSTFVGGSARDYGWDIAADAAGNAYITGETESSNYPTTPGAHKRIGAFDAIVTKLDPSGSALVYSTLLGGSDEDRSYGIAVGGDRAFVAGWTKSLDFPAVDAFQRSYGGGLQDAFVTSVNAAGSALAYSSYLGGSLWDEARGIAVDGVGAAYLTGATTSRNFPTKNPIQGFAGGLEHPDDAFVTKVAASGHQLSDVVSVTKAVYAPDTKTLTVAATSTDSSATLTAYVTSTDARIGTLRNRGEGRYGRRFRWPSNPQNVTVRSSSGGSDSRDVTTR
jgi:hypothetical protein